MTEGLVVVGGILQVAGIACAAWGIREVRKNWTDLPGIKSRVERRIEIVRTWVRHQLAHVFPSLRRDVTVHATGATVFGYSASGTPTVSPPPVPEDLSERAEWLVARVRELWESADRASADHAELTEALAVDRQRLADEVGRLEAGLRSKLSDLAGGGLRLQTWGVIFLILGTALTILGAL
jgi:hypothetical protein